MKYIVTSILLMTNSAWSHHTNLIEKEINIPALFVMAGLILAAILLIGKRKEA